MSIGVLCFRVVPFLCLLMSAGMVQMDGRGCHPVCRGTQVPVVHLYKRDVQELYKSCNIC